MDGERNRERKKSRIGERERKVSGRRWLREAVKRKGWGRWFSLRQEEGGKGMRLVVVRLCL